MRLSKVTSLQIKETLLCRLGNQVLRRRLFAGCRLFFLPPYPRRAVYRQPLLGLLPRAVIHLFLAGRTVETMPAGVLENGLAIGVAGLPYAEDATRVVF